MSRPQQADDPLLIARVNNMTTPNSKRHLGLAALIPGLAIVFMDQTILPVALPTIQQQFQVGNVALQWAVNAYLLTIVILVLAAGKIGDRIGHRQAFIASIVLFALASQQMELSQAILDARIAAFSIVHFVLAALLLVVFAIVFTLHHRKSAHHLPPSIGRGSTSSSAKGLYPFET
jgi:MFS family permease